MAVAFGVTKYPVSMNAVFTEDLSLSVIRLGLFRDLGYRFYLISDTTC